MIDDADAFVDRPACSFLALERLARPQVEVRAQLSKVLRFVLRAELADDLRVWPRRCAHSAMSQKEDAELTRRWLVVAVEFRCRERHTAEGTSASAEIRE